MKVRSSWIRIAPTSNDRCAYERSQTHREEGHVKTEKRLEGHSHRARNTKSHHKLEEANTTYLGP